VARGLAAAPHGSPRLLSGVTCSAASAASYITEYYSVTCCGVARAALAAAPWLTGLAVVGPSRRVQRRRRAGPLAAGCWLAPGLARRLMDAVERG